jgi:hypothetical protein
LDASHDIEELNRVLESQQSAIVPAQSSDPSILTGIPESLISGLTHLHVIRLFPDYELGDSLVAFFWPSKLS